MRRAIGHAGRRGMRTKPATGSRAQCALQITIPAGQFARIATAAACRGVASISDGGAAGRPRPARPAAGARLPGSGALMHREGGGVGAGEVQRKTGRRCTATRQARWKVALSSARHSQPLSRLVPGSPQRTPAVGDEGVDVQQKVVVEGVHQLDVGEIKVQPPPVTAGTTRLRAVCRLSK